MRCSFARVLGAPCRVKRSRLLTQVAIDMRSQVSLSCFVCFLSGVVSVVASGFSLRVDPGGWEEFGGSVVGELDLPVAVVDEVVVVVAEQDAVGQGGSSAV